MLRGLFKTYPDANRKDNEALRNYFSTHSKVGEKTLNLIVRTFKTLCELGDFESSDSVTVINGIKEEKTSENKSKVTKVIQQPGMTVNINVQLQLQATDDAAVYEKFFAAMKKHLLPPE